MEKLALGDFGGAVDEVGGALDYVSGFIGFDIDVFEQNLRNAFDGEAVGYTYAVALNGNVVVEEGVGQARTIPDSPANQYADKQVMVASVSKTLTAVLVLGLMEQEGVHPDDLIKPYLPSYWSFGDGMDLLTFRQLLTHTSGFKQLINTMPPGTFGNDYQGLRTLLATDLPAGPGPYGYQYTNLNFALQRILVAGLMGIDPFDYPEFEGATLTASAFQIQLQSLYGGIGVPASCSPTDPEPTLMYRWPLDGSPGGESSDKVLTCGGYGFFISAHQLAGVLANLRYTENLMSQTQFDTMRDGLLGLKSWGGVQGNYLGHDGEWTPGMQSCIMMFPINVDVAITVNSIGGNYPSPCSVVRSAFDNAWVAMY